MSGGFNLEDYVDVAERIRLFYQTYPDGRLVTVKHGRYLTEGNPPQEFVYCEARAYRTADDPTPCAGTAWEPVPGATPYTRLSELQNAETAAWGRAIVAAGIPSKKIASAQEVQARQNAPDPVQPLAPADTVANVTKAQHAKIGVLVKELDRGVAPDGYGDWVSYSRAWCGEQFGKHSRKDLTAAEAGSLINMLQAAVDQQVI